MYIHPVSITILSHTCTISYIPPPPLSLICIYTGAGSETIKHFLNDYKSVRFNTVLIDEAAQCTYYKHIDYMYSCYTHIH